MFVNKKLAFLRFATVGKMKISKYKRFNMRVVYRGVQQRERLLSLWWKFSSCPLLLRIDITTNERSRVTGAL